MTSSTNDTRAQPAAAAEPDFKALAAEARDACFVVEAFKKDDKQYMILVDLMRRMADALDRLGRQSAQPPASGDLPEDVERMRFSLSKHGLKDAADLIERLAARFSGGDVKP